MNYIDPTTIRLSEHFLLSDLMGCNSVYAKGIPNLFDDDRRKFQEGRTLARELLEPLLERSRLSVTYGYISPSLSQAIVKYQDPNKPSYHRWDDGAACDVVLHQYVHADLPPIYGAFWIDENLPTSRTITYSESPCICVATRAEEIRKGDPRRALYENRYVGQRKPQYIPYSNSHATRTSQKAAVELKHHWTGGGFPSYHGGGILQAQHIRTSKYTLLSDFLMSPTAMAEGYVNMPTSLTARGLVRFRRAGRAYDRLLEETSARRMSIVKAYQSSEWCEDGPSNWKDGAYLVLVPPEGMDAEAVAHTAEAIPGVSMVRVGKGRRISVALLDKDENEGSKKVQAEVVAQAAPAPTSVGRRSRVRPSW